jgi:Arc/MetJ family transcription regulator
VGKTTIDIDDELVARASVVVGTSGTTETVQKALEEVVAREARLRLAERLRTMTGIDLDDAEVMAQAWR